mmetsp:Transcript_23279/g.75058  ORF Transcript_23279/g.75058 Transcript_23279/m.75058 type:complete len:143 (+) Transcript_23279:76-504(+)
MAAITAANVAGLERTFSFPANTQTVWVHLQRATLKQAFGVALSGRSAPPVIVNIQPHGLASARLRLGDRIEVINGVAVSDEKAAKRILRAAIGDVTIRIARRRGGGVTPTEADDWSVSSAGPWGGDPPEHIHTQSDEEAIAP